MRRITSVQTSDGIVHKAEADARRYCEDRCMSILTSLAHHLVHLDKYSQITGFLSGNLSALETAARWRAESQEDLEED